MGDPNNRKLLFPYYDMATAGALRWPAEAVKTWLGSIHVPAGFALFPKNLVTPPREWAERFFNVQRWTEIPRGGHFAVMEEPELFVEDVGSMFSRYGQSLKRLDANTILTAHSIPNPWNSEDS